MNANLTKKAKEELLENIEEKERDIKDLYAQIEKLDKYKQFHDNAELIRAAHESYVTAGFTDDQAFELLKIMLKNIHFKSAKIPG